MTLPVLLFLLFHAYSCKQPQPQTDAKLRVLTTIAPLYSFAVNVAGDTARVDNLLPSGAGPHEYSLSPADARRITLAQVIIKNGVYLEEWLDGILVSSGKTPDDGRTFVTDTSIGVDIVNNDPHIWLSPRNAVIQVKNIRDALIQADPANTDVYQRNAAAYIERLESLDREIAHEVKTWKRRDFVAFHSAFRYFVRDYGLTLAAVIQETPETEPSPKHIADVMEVITSRGITSILTEPQVTHRIVQSLADDLHLQVYRLDTLETGTPDKGWYIDKMRMNLETLKKALN